MTLHGTNPPGAKAPEGNLYKEQDSSGVKSESLKTGNSATGNVSEDSIKKVDSKDLKSDTSATKK